MPDILDVYTDGVSLNIGPFGYAMNFAMSPSAGQGAVRTSLEHLKVMAS